MDRSCARVGPDSTLDYLGSRASAGVFVGVVTVLVAAHDDHRGRREHLERFGAQHLGGEHLDRTAQLTHRARESVVKGVRRRVCFGCRGQAVAVVSTRRPMRQAQRGRTHARAVGERDHGRAGRAGLHRLTVADRRAGHRLRIAALRVTADADKRSVESLAADQPCRNAQMQARRDADRIRHAMDARDLAPRSRQHGNPIGHADRRIGPPDQEVDHRVFGARTLGRQLSNALRTRDCP